MQQVPYNQPVAWSYKSQSGTTAGVQISANPGMLHSFVVNSATTGAVVTLYDGTSTAGPVISTFTLGTVTNPQVATVYDIVLTTGLFVVIATAAASITFTFH